jgi:selenocysteine-specific elongation factor
MTLGGGVVLDVAPPHRRRSDPALAAELRQLVAQDPRTSVEARVVRSGYRGAEKAALQRETGLEERVLANILHELSQNGRTARVGDCWIAATALDRLEGRVLQALDGFHEREPLRPGAPRASLGGALPDNAAPGALDLVLDRLAARRELEVDADLVRRPGHRPQLSPEEEKWIEHIRAGCREAALEPPTLREWSDRLQLPPERVRPLLVHLERQGELIRAPGELWFDRHSVDELRTRVVKRISADGPLTTPEYKKLIGTTRKHAVPLMELFDAERTTLRRGEVRVLRKSSSG